MKKKLFFILRIIIGLGIIFVLFRFIPYRNLINLYRESAKSYIILAFLVFVMINVLGILRWRFILHSLGVNACIKEITYVYFSSLFFNLFFPSLLGGDFFRGASLSYRHKKTSKVVSSVVMDRFSGAFGLGLVSFFACVLGNTFGNARIKAQDILLIISIFMAVIILIVLILFNKFLFQRLNRHIKGGLLKKKLVRFYNELYFFRDNPGIFLKSVLYSCAIQAASCIVFFIISRAFFLKTGMVYFFILVPIVQFISTLPLTIAGLGTRDAAAVYFFSRIGIDKSVALSMSFTFLFCTILMSLIGGVIYVMVYHRWLERNP